MTHELDMYTIPHTATIRDAMEKIEANKHRAVVVIDGEGCVVGLVSDGDVRRAFLHDAMQISPPAAISGKGRPTSAPLTLRFPMMMTR